jgi:hypothetical protein
VRAATLLEHRVLLFERQVSVGGQGALVVGELVELGVTMIDEDGDTEGQNV